VVTSYHYMSSFDVIMFQTRHFLEQAVRTYKTRESLGARTPTQLPCALLPSLPSSPLPPPSHPPSRASAPVRIDVCVAVDMKKSAHAHTHAQTHRTDTQARTYTNTHTHRGGGWCCNVWCVHIAVVCKCVTCGLPCILMYNSHLAGYTIRRRHFPQHGHGQERPRSCHHCV